MPDASATHFTSSYSVIPRLTLLAACAATGLEAAEGSRLIGTGPNQLATAGAGVASPQDSTWLALNAAGLTEVGHRIDGGLELISAEVTLDSSDAALGNPIGEQTDDVIVVAPQLTYARPMLDGDAAFGVGFYTVSGLLVEFDEARSVFGAGGGYDTHSEIGVTRLSTAWAQCVGERTSIGLAANLNYMTLESDIITSDGSQTEGEDEQEGVLGAGFQLSLLHRMDLASFGFAYTSRQWMDSFDDYDDVLIGPLDMPAVVQLGAAWHLGDRFDLLTDIRWIDWSSVEAFGDDSDGFGWRDQVVYKLAARYRATPQLALMAGVSYGNSPIEEEDVFVNGLSMLITEWHLTAGAAWTIAERWEVQGSLLYAPREELTDDGSKLGGAGEDTTIGIELFSIGLGLGYAL